MHITDFQIYKINLGHMAISNSGPQTVLRLIPEIYRSPHIPELMRRARSLTELITDLQCTPPEVKKADCELQHPPAIRIERMFFIFWIRIQSKLVQAGAALSEVSEKGPFRRPFPLPASAEAAVIFMNTMVKMFRSKNTTLTIKLQACWL